MTDKQQPGALLPPDIFGCDPAVVQVDAATTQQLVLALKIQHAELETLTLYKNLADEYGLSIFKDLKDLTTEIENLREKLKSYEDLGGAADDVQLLRMGYAAARLEIESLKAQLAGRAKEQADELAVAPTTQPAPQQEAHPVTPYTCPKCHALWLHWPAEQSGFGMDTLNCRSTTHCDYCEKGGVEQLERLERVPAALKAPQQEAQEPVGYTHASWIAEAKRGGGGSFVGRKNAAFDVPIYTAPPHSPAAQGDALDAARYRFLRDGEWRDTDLEPFIRLQLNTLWDAKIDAAHAAQEGK